VRRVMVEFADDIAVTYVTSGLAREFRTPVDTMRHVVPSMAGAQGARRPGFGRASPAHGGAPPDGEAWRGGSRRYPIDV
jgi:hypothetical protein